MALISCPECKHQVSTTAAACPHCGHPMSSTVKAASGPKCYACSATATTRCQSCGVMSCVQHLESAYVSNGRGIFDGVHQLRCQSCCDSAAAGWVFIGVLVVLGIIGVIVWATYGPQWFPPPGGR